MMIACGQAAKLSARFGSLLSFVTAIGGPRDLEYAAPKGFWKPANFFADGVRATIIYYRTNARAWAFDKGAGQRDYSSSKRKPKLGCHRSKTGSR